jgi:hypothetical protein
MERPGARSCGKSWSKLFGVVLALILSLPVAARGADLDWDIPGSGDFFNSSFWSPTQIPTFIDDAYIRNGGEPDALTGAAVQAHSLIVGDAVTGNSVYDGDGRLFVQSGDLQVVDNLLVAAHSSSQAAANGYSILGHLTVRQTSLLEVAGGAAEHDFRVGFANVDVGQFVNPEGSVNVEHVTTVTVGDDFVVGGTNNEGGTVDVFGGVSLTDITDVSIGGNFDVARSQYRARTNHASGDTAGHLTNLRRITNVDVGGDFHIVRTDYTAGPADPFRITHDARSNIVPITDVENLHVHGHMEIGTATVDFQAGAEQVVGFVDARILLQRVDSMMVDGNYFVGSYRGVDENPTTHQQITSAFIASNFESVPSIQILGEVHSGVIDFDSSTGDLHTTSNYQVGAQLFLKASEMVANRPVSVGVIGGTANILGASAYGTLPMHAATLTTPKLRVGVIENPGVSGTAEGTMVLLGSFIDTEQLIEGEGGEISFHLGGLERITIDTFDGVTLASVDGTYSAIDAADALLQGNIISDFDFTPPFPGTYSFDLITTDSLTALDDISADLSIVDLPEDFCVLFYGVTEETGVDVLRLTIGECIPEPGTLMISLVGCLALVCRRRKL